ncbi:hypothetical protein GGR52DRAFT_561431 [Hypoxylon sp. FL1284]|nr:hypothetical protein GGR52DRAFT_561431 [Hypoxylon sp. FL1284]
MPPKKTPDSEDKSGPNITLNTAEVRIVDTFFKCCPPTARSIIDWDEATKKLGYKNKKVTWDRFHQVFKKFHWFESEKPADKAITSSAPATPSKKRAAEDVSPSKDDALLTPGSYHEEDVAKSPLKKRRVATPKGPLKVKREVGPDADIGLVSGLHLDDEA